MSFGYSSIHLKHDNYRAAALPILFVMCHPSGAAQVVFKRKRTIALTRIPLTAIFHAGPFWEFREML
jgi:hypothetical protein